MGEEEEVGCCVIALVLLDQRVVAIRSACVRQRLASSILNVFSLCGVAARSAASAALRKALSFAGLPVSAPSASADRQGLVPTPPSAMRAYVMLPLAIVSTTAADARANSYDARSRSFRYTCLLEAIGGGSVTCVIRSPGRSTVSRCGVLLGSRWKSPNATAREPFVP